MHQPKHLVWGPEGKKQSASGLRFGPEITFWWGLRKLNSKMSWSCLCAISLLGCFHKWSSGGIIYTGWELIRKSFTASLGLAMACKTSQKHCSRMCRIPFLDLFSSPCLYGEANTGSPPKGCSQENSVLDMQFTLCSAQILRHQRQHTRHCPL